MDRDLHIAHMEFGEVAAFLLSDDGQSEEQASRRANIANSTVRVRNSSSRLGSHRANASVKKKREALNRSDEHKSRPFLAQYAISEIPSLEQDLTPFPDLTKTGE